MNNRKLLLKAMSGAKNLRFGDMLKLVQAFGFRQARVRGSHHIFENPLVPELVNLQNRKGKGKRYQVRQFLEIVEQHNLIIENDE